MGRRRPPMIFRAWTPFCGRATLQTQQSYSLQAAVPEGGVDSVLSITDLSVGFVLALILAALALFLQNQRSQDDLVFGSDDVNEAIPSLTVNATTTAQTFEDWNEMSQPDNYIWYNTRLRSRKMNKQAEHPPSLKEQRWVLPALLVLFTPIFTFEFFLTVSRQLFCAFSQDLCSPYIP